MGRENKRSHNIELEDEFVVVFRQLVYDAIKDDYNTYCQKQKENADNTNDAGRFYPAIERMIGDSKAKSINADVYSDSSLTSSRSKRAEYNNRLFNEFLKYSPKECQNAYDIAYLKNQLLKIEYVRQRFKDWYGITDCNTMDKLLEEMGDDRVILAHPGTEDYVKLIRAQDKRYKDFFNLCENDVSEDAGMMIRKYNHESEKIIKRAGNKIEILKFCEKYNLNYKDIMIYLFEREEQFVFDSDYVYGISEETLSERVEESKKAEKAEEENRRAEKEEIKRKKAEKKLNQQYETINQQYDKIQEQEQIIDNLMKEAEDASNDKVTAWRAVAKAKEENEALWDELYRLKNSNEYNSASANDEPSDSGNKSSGSGIGCLIIIIAIILIGVFIIRPIVNHSKEKKAEKASVSASVSQVEEQQGTKLVEFSDVAKDDAVSVVTDYTDTDNYGNKYDNNLYASAQYSMITYNLGGKFDKLSGTWYLSENGKNTDKKHYFKIIVDGETVYTSPTLEKGSAPKEVKADLKFGKEMTIVFVSDDSAGFGNPAISCSDSSKAKSLEGDVVVPAWLTSIEPLKADDNINITDYSDNSSFPQTKISHYLTGDTTDYNDEGTQISKIKKAEFLLDGKYSKLSGLWVFTEYRKDSNSKCQFEMYADGKLVYTSDVIDASSEPKEFTVDINKCDKLTIAFTSGDGSAALSSVLLY